MIIMTFISYDGRYTSRYDEPTSFSAFPPPLLSFYSLLWSSSGSVSTATSFLDMCPEPEGLSLVAVTGTEWDRMGNWEQTAIQSSYDVRGPPVTKPCTTSKYRCTIHIYSSHRLELQNLLELHSTKKSLCKAKEQTNSANLPVAKG